MINGICNQLSSAFGSISRMGPDEVSSEKLNPNARGFNVAMDDWDDELDDDLDPTDDYGGDMEDDDLDDDDDDD